MKAPAKLRKIAERIHGRRKVYAVNGIAPVKTVCETINPHIYSDRARSGEQSVLKLVIVRS